MQGQVRATGSITSFYSDQRLKTVLGPIDDPLGRLKNLRGVYYRVNNLAKSYGYQDDGRNVGLIAQDLERVLPEVVRPAPFDVQSNNASRSGQNYLTVLYSRVVPLLIEALKQQKVQLDRIGNKLREKARDER